MASIFSKIIAGEIPCYKIAETDKYLAFLDVFPMQKGHTLVIPKIEVDYLFDLDEETYNGLWSFARTVAKAIDAAIDCERVGVTVLGMEVPHAHIHLVPLNTEGDLSFSLPKLKFSEDEFKDIALSIASELA
jgi:histidine triad (HIT) family protein